MDAVLKYKEEYGVPLWNYSVGISVDNGYQLFVPVYKKESQDEIQTIWHFGVYDNRLYHFTLNRPQSTIVEEYWKFDYFTTFALGEKPSSGLYFKDVALSRSAYVGMEISEFTNNNDKLRIMKRTILIQVIIVCSIVSTFSQTNYYETTKTFVENGYTYQCDVPAYKLITLYNKANKYTYIDQKVNTTGELVPIDGMQDTFEDDYWTKSKCYEIVENAFSTDQKSRMTGNGITIAMYISPTTGKVMEVNFQFTTFNPAATIPLTVYRQIEIDLKNYVWFIPTSYGKTLNYIFLGWRYEFE